MNNKTDNSTIPTPSRETAVNQPNTPQELLRDMAALTQAAQEAVNGSVTDVVGGWVAAQLGGPA
jgi:hypothetical protein